MSVIEAAAAGFKDMADGTVRFFFDVEPRHAEDALRLFRARGTPAALAALKVGHAAKNDAPEPEKPRGGKKAMDAARVCLNPDFQRFAAMHGFERSADGARDFMCNRCEMESRAELDHREDCQRRFVKLMADFRELTEQAA